MLAGELAHILKKTRILSPGNIRSALRIIDDALGDIYPLSTVILEIPAEDTIYVSRWIESPEDEEGGSIRQIVDDPLRRWVVLDRVEDVNNDRALSDPGAERYDTGGEHSALAVPVYSAGRQLASLYLISKRGQRMEDVPVPDISEVISIILSPFIVSKGQGTIDRTRSMKIELLDAIKDELAMKGVLLKMMERAQSEFCAFFTGVGDPCLHLMIDSRELSPRLPEIREKLLSSYRMFSNAGSDPDYCREKVYYRSRQNNISYLVGNSRIESYFLVPVLFDSAVMGVLYFGSVREDAFVRETISFFEGMAGEEESESRIMYMLRGETSVISNVIDQIPSGCALLSGEGKIIHANTAFSLVLGLDGSVPENIDEIGRMTGYSLSGPYSEYRMTGRLDSRELWQEEDEGGCISVSIIRLDKISPDVSSLMILDDLSDAKEQERSTDEMLATVAHELRTPMTGLRNSLKLLSMRREQVESGPESLKRSESDHDSRFLNTALRTVDRLSILVDGIVGTSSIRLKDRQPRFEVVDAEYLLRDSCRIFSGTFAKKEITLHIGVDVGAGDLFVDFDMMSQVVQNLVSNSLKKVPAGGSIRLEVSSGFDRLPGKESELPALLLQDTAFTRIRISDSGPGIPAEVMERINAPTGPANRRTTRFKGLGLHISGKLIEAHGGRMHSGSRDSEGGSIDIYFPADRKTSSVIRSINTCGSVFERMVAGGTTPVVGILRKDDEGCWLETSSRWDSRPVIEPDEESAVDCDSCLWPISERIAVCLYAVDRESGAGATDNWSERGGQANRYGNIVDYGFAEYPVDGRKFARLLERSVEAVSTRVIINH